MFFYLFLKTGTLKSSIFYKESDKKRKSEQIKNCQIKKTISYLSPL